VGFFTSAFLSIFFIPFGAVIPSEVIFRDFPFFIHSRLLEKE
jgi:hypothetical protein